MFYQEQTTTFRDGFFFFSTSCDIQRDQRPLTYMAEMNPTSILYCLWNKRLSVTGNNLHKGGRTMRRWSRSRLERLLYRLKKFDAENGKLQQPADCPGLADLWTRYALVQSSSTGSGNSLDWRGRLRTRVQFASITGLSRGPRSCHVFLIYCLGH